MITFYSGCVRKQIKYDATATAISKEHNKYSYGVNYIV